LRTLSLDSETLPPGMLERLVRAPVGARLENLQLSYCGVEDRDVLAILAAQLPLISLDLQETQIGPAVSSAIASAPHHAGLRELRLVDTAIGAEGVDALVASPYLSRELRLTLDEELLGLEYDEESDQWRGSPFAHIASRFPNVQ
jgi:hypothetical protein